MWWQKKSVTLVEAETNTFSVDPSRQAACMAARSIQESHFSFGGQFFPFMCRWLGSPAAFVGASVYPPSFFPLASNFCEMGSVPWWQKIQTKQQNNKYLVMALWLLFGSRVQCDPSRIALGQVFEACFRASLCGWRHGRRRVLRSSRRSCCVGERLWRGVGERRVCLDRAFCSNSVFNRMVLNVVRSSRAPTWHVSQHGNHNIYRVKAISGRQMRSCSWKNAGRHQVGIETAEGEGEEEGYGDEF